MSEQCMRCYLAGGGLVFAMVAIIALAHVLIDHLFPASPAPDKKEQP